MIACRTPCALEPDVSEANSFSLNRAGAPNLWQPGYLDERDPFALRPAVTGGLPFSRVLASGQAKTVPCCNTCHSNCESGDLVKILYCILHDNLQNAAQNCELRRR